MEKKYELDTGFFLMFSGCLFGFSIFLVTLYIFLTAYFNKTKTTLVLINHHGEADIELFLMFIMFCLFTICCVYGTKRIFKGK